MQITTNEGLDAAKLSLFPLTRAELMVSLLLSTLLDGSTLAIVFMFIAIVAGWAFSLPLALLALLVVLVFYVQVIGMSQLVVAVLSRMLQSRRLRDLSVILVVICSAAGYLSQFAFQNKSFIEALRTDSLATYLQWLPSGMAARAIQQASLGNWSISFAWLAALAVLDVLVLLLWQMVVERALATPEIGGGQRTRRRAAQPVLAGVATSPVQVVAVNDGRRRVIPAQVLAIAGKDVKYFRRDPQLARLILLPLVYIVVLALSMVYGSSYRGVGSVPMGDLAALFDVVRVMFTPSIVLFSLYSLAYNTLGFERQSLTTLLLFPVRPHYILWGKNLVVFVLGILELVAMVLVVSFVTHTWAFALPALTLGLAGTGVILACGNITSVFMPQRLRLAQRGFQSTGASMSAQSGCLRIVMSFLAMLVAVIILLPVGAALILPVIFQLYWLWLLAIPFSLLYGAVIYYKITSLVAPYLIARTPELLALVASE